MEPSRTYLSPLTNPEHSERHSVFQHVPGWDIDKLKCARILVVGAGALGNEVIKNLALLGVGEITIVDFDRIEPGNLSRSVLFRGSDTGQLKSEVAAKRVREINPDIKTGFINGDILCDVGLGFIRQMDLIFGCLDNRLARLWLNRLAFRAGKSWIGGGILNLSGQATLFAKEEVCYECSLDRSGWSDIHQRLGCSDMAQRYFNAGIQPTTPISASIIGGVMVQEGLKILFCHEADRLRGQMWSYEGQKLHSNVYDLAPPKEGCISHFTWPKPEKIPGLNTEVTLGDLFFKLNAKWGKGLWIELDHPIALEVATMTSKKVFPFVKPLLHLSDEIADTFRRVQNEGLGVPPGKLVSRIDKDFPYAERSLAKLGIPEQQILRLHRNEKIHYLELDG